MSTDRRLLTSSIHCVYRPRYTDCVHPPLSAVYRRRLPTVSTDRVYRPPYSDRCLPRRHLLCLATASSDRGGISQLRVPPASTEIVYRSRSPLSSTEAVYGPPRFTAVCRRHLRLHLPTAFTDRVYRPPSTNGTYQLHPPIVSTDRVYRPPSIDHLRLPTASANMRLPTASTDRD